MGLKKYDNFTLVCTSAYPDDVVVILRNQDDVNKISSIVHEFGTIIGKRVQVY